MKISAQDEYGLRVLLQIARSDSQTGISIPQLMKVEGLSQSYVAKLTRALRLANLIQSTRGHKGGYVLARPAASITINEVFNALGGTLFEDGFSEPHSDMLSLCTNSIDCSINSLWKIVNFAMDRVLGRITLANLMRCDTEVNQSLKKILEEEFISLQQMSIQ
ncbi:MAG: Rrf2 family transcriptional regulator [Bacteroidota bacterium]